MHDRAAVIVPTVTGKACNNRSPSVHGQLVRCDASFACKNNVNAVYHRRDLFVAINEGTAEPQRENTHQNTPTKPPLW